MYNSELTTQKIKLVNLHLDPNNPRFTDPGPKVPDRRVPEEAVQTRTGTKIFREGVEELVGSILTNGFLPLDRIVVRELNGVPGEYIAVEGNRRLAALRTVDKRVTEADIDEADFSQERQEAVRASIQEIDCLVYTGGETSDIAWILQGIRHISGIRDWTPAQRAELISKEIDDHGLLARQVGQMLGISTQAVNRLYRANRGLTQMLDDEEYGARAKKEYFTLFEEAHSKRKVRQWLGWDDVTQSYLNDDNLHAFYDWVSEDPSHEGKRRIHDPRQVASLDRIIGAQKTELLDQLGAWEITIDEAKGRLDQSSENATNWRDQVQRATAALQSIPAVAITSDGKDLQAALVALREAIDGLLVAVQAGTGPSTGESSGT